MKTFVTQERLKEVLSHDIETGVFSWNERRGKGRIGAAAGCVNYRGYVEIRVDNTTYLAHRLAWLYIYGYFPENGIDHINRNKQDNMIANLREVSQSCNLRNTGNRAKNLSGVKGVCASRGKWRAQVTINNHHFYLGRYPCLSEAVAVRLAAEQCVGWEGCDSTSPAFVYMQDYLKSNKEKA